MTHFSRLLLIASSANAVFARDPIAIRNGDYSMVAELDSQVLRATITGPAGARTWTCATFDVLSGAVLSKNGEAAFTGELAADAVVVGIRYVAGKKENQCVPGMGLSDPKNNTGIGKLPLHPGDPGLEPDPWRGRARPLEKALPPTLAGFDRKGNLKGVLNGLESHSRAPQPVSIPYVWKLRQQAATPPRI